MNRRAIWAICQCWFIAQDQILLQSSYLFGEVQDSHEEIIVVLWGGEGAGRNIFTFLARCRKEEVWVKRPHQLAGGWACSWTAPWIGLPPLMLVDCSIGRWRWGKKEYRDAYILWWCLWNCMGWPLVFEVDGTRFGGPNGIAMRPWVLRYIMMTLLWARRSCRDCHWRSRIICVTLWRGS